MKLKLVILFAISTLGILSCYKTPEYPDTPFIEFDSYNVTQPYNTTGDSIGSMFIKFTDGDGDLGRLGNSDSSSRIFLTHNFFDAVDTFYIPKIPAKGTSKAISGTIEIKFSFLYGICAVPGVTQPTDTGIFNIFIEDRAGHLSNTITTPPLVIKCP